MGGDLGCLQRSHINLCPGPRLGGGTVPSWDLVPEMLITAAGENVAPIPIETLVKEKIPIISNAVLVGDKAKFLSMLLTLKVPWAVPAPRGRGRRWPEFRVWLWVWVGVGDDQGTCMVTALSWGSVRQTE